MLKSTPEPSVTEQQEEVRPPLRTLFEQEESNLLRYAFSLTRRRAVAEEIVQEVFLKLHSKWNEVDMPRPWLYRSVRNRALNHLRQSGREVLQDDDSNHESQAQSHEENPEDGLMRTETETTLRQIIGELDERDRELIKLKYFEGLKYREIAEQTGLTVSNVGYRLHHILKTLSNRLQPLGILGVEESS